MKGGRALRSLFALVAILSLATSPAMATVTVAPCTVPVAGCDMVVADDGATIESSDMGCCQEPTDSTEVEAVLGTSDSSRRPAVSPDRLMTTVTSAPRCSAPSPAPVVSAGATLPSPAPSPPLPDQLPLLL